MKKIVITGALGHIGSKVVRELPKVYPEVEIVMIDNLLTQRYCSLFNLPATRKYRFIEADVTKINLNPIIIGADVVLHLAAITDAANSFNNRELVEHVNYNATVKVAKSCSHLNCPMIHLSSTSVYGTQRDSVDEDCSSSELLPQSPYAETKLKEERFLQKMGNKGKIRYITCRFGTICGTSPGMRFHTAVNKFCWQAVMGQPLTVWKTALHQKRPYLTLDDAVKAITFITNSELYDNCIYNVLTDNLTVQSIIKLIQKHISDPIIDFVDKEIMNQLSYEVLNHRFKNKNFQFTGSVKNSVAETINLLKSLAVKQQL